MAAIPSSSSGPRKSAPSAARRGRLKIFLGYTSGVGKTFRMLDEARRRKERDEDVIVAAHQPGAQAEIRTLLDKLEVIPALRTSLGEGLHMQAILKRRPQVCVIDPLAHNNPAGFPHASRWEDIEEILSSGISVLTAVNLLHVEELRERVEAISGKQTKETVPRRFLAEADEIVVVDAPVSVVLERKQQLSTERRDAQELTHALSEQREMTLVFAAQLAERQLERYLEDHDIQQLWGVHERILVCLTPRSNGESMIASGKRNQERFHGELYVVYSHLPHLSKDDKARLDGFLKLSKEAGAQVSMLRGEDPIDAILEFAKKKKVTQIFVGHSRRDDWLSRIWASPLDHLLRGAEHMDVRIFPQ